MARSVILGAGFGGIAVATELRRLLGDDHEAVLIDADEEFSMGLRKHWELVGIGAIAQGSRSRWRLAGGGIEFVHGRVEEIDPVARGPCARTAAPGRPTSSSWRWARSRGRISCPA